MSRHCKVCIAPSRRKWDRLLLEGHTFAEVGRLAKLSDDTVRRHFHAHLKEPLRKRALAEKETLHRGGRLQEQLEAISGQAEAILEKATAANNLGVALQACRELRELARLSAIAAGELQGEGTTVNINVKQQRPLTREEACQLARDVLAIYSGPEKALPAAGAAPTIEGEVNHVEE